VASQAIAGTDYQAPSANLTALLALAGTGFTVKTGANTWAQRTILGTVNRISTTNADGIAGNVAVDISSLYTGQSSITTLGTIATGTWNGSVIGSALWRQRHRRQRMLWRSFCSRPAQRCAPARAGRARLRARSRRLHRHASARCGHRGIDQHHPDEQSSGWYCDFGQ
jgi:hypothetical protein